MDLALINAIPLVLAILLAIPGLEGVWRREVRTAVTTGTMVLLFVALLGYFPFLQEAGATMSAVSRVVEWVPEMGISLSFYLDGLALFFALIVTGIGAGIFLYTGYYFDDDAEGLRFTRFLMAFAGAMLGVVISGNLITLFVMWELTSITSFMLIGFKGAKYPDARFGALQALLITGGGALALILGLALLGVVAGQANGTGPTYELSQILQLDPITAHPYYGAIALLIMIGAFTKSAQFPFHFWLPNAMSAPTPASSYLHSATMVKAGIFLLMRLYPVMQGGSEWTIGLVVIGTLTMLIGAYFSLGKRDLKGVLAYLTVSTLGAIVALVGLPAYEGIKAAVLMILAHALYKAALFLAVGTIEHNTGTRSLDELGGLRRQMPLFAAVVAISALSMAGMIPLVGFVAKELFLDAFLHWEAAASAFITAVLAFSAMLTVTAGAMVYWDVFETPPQHEVHYHASSPILAITPALLALGTILFAVFITFDIVLEPLVQQISPKQISLYLLPSGGLSNPAFQISTLAIIIGVALFVVRRRWLWVTRPPMISGPTFFRAFTQGLDWIGDQVVRSQNGQIRYYLVVIFATLSGLLLTANLIPDLVTDLGNVQATSDAISLFKAMLLVMCCACAFYVTVARNHLVAALSLGLVGYTIGGLYLLEPAPDVALVQLLVETLGTILIIVMLGRISQRQRRAVMARLWKGRSRFDDRPLGIYRDMVVAGSVGFVVFVFTLTALLNRPPVTAGAFQAFCAMPLEEGIPAAAQPGRSIAIYHVCNTQADFGFTDIVGAIVTEYRGMDTMIEIAVFTAAALGVLTLLSRGLNMANPLSARRSKAYSDFDREALSEIRETTRLSTPFTRYVSRLVLPLGFMVALAHLNYGGTGPGDGFTAGALLGLVVALWYVVFGYAEARQRLALFAPHRLVRLGLLLVIVNAFLPLLLGGSFMGHVEYDRLLGLYDVFGFFGLHLTSTFVYETSIMLTVFGGFSSIVEAIAHPQESAELDAATLEEAS
jgi:NADH:ubiquinone oxidoreductase subunit 5 (subunit L)/multisubunit Na+/H+ antiporter MnhA subunit